jgi:hypothetical protein
VEIAAITVTLKICGSVTSQSQASLDLLDGSLLRDLKKLFVRQPRKTDATNVMQIVDRKGNAQDCKLRGLSFKRLVKGDGFFRFGMLELLSTIIFIPIAIGLVVECYAWATYYEVIVWQQPLEPLRRFVVNALLNSYGELSRTYYCCLLTTVTNVFSWILTAFAVGVYSWIRVTLARRFAKVLVSSVPLVQFILAPPITAGVLSLAIARCICVALAMVPSLIVFVLICKLRPIHEAGNESSSNLQIVWRSLVISVIVLGTLALSASGWRAAQANDIFNIG